MLPSPTRDLQPSLRRGAPAVEPYEAAPSRALAWVGAGAGAFAYALPLAVLLRAAGPAWTAAALVPWTWLWVPVGQFALHPLLLRAGVYRYFSPMLCALAPTAERLDLHAGTAYDALRLLRWRDRGAAAARQQTLWLLDGLLAIADAVARGEYPPDVAVTGTSYVFGRAPGRLGFRSERPALADRLNLWLNALDLAWRLSFARGRPAFPDLRRARRYATTGTELLAHRDEIARLRRRLTRRWQESGRP